MDDQKSYLGQCLMEIRGFGAVRSGHISGFVTNTRQVKFDYQWDIQAVDLVSRLTVLPGEPLGLRNSSSQSIFALKTWQHTHRQASGINRKQKISPALTKDSAALIIAARCKELHLGQDATMLRIPAKNIRFPTLKQRLGRRVSGRQAQGRGVMPAGPPSRRAVRVITA